MAATSPLTEAERRAIFARREPTTRTGMAPLRRKEDTAGLSAQQKWNLTISDILQSVLLEPTEDDKAITKFTKVTRALVDEAMAGSAEHIKIVYERLEGKAAQNVRVDGQIQLSWADLVKKAIDVSHRVISDEVDDPA